jgi:hypothetical protein
MGSVILLTRTRLADGMSKQKDTSDGVLLVDRGSPLAQPSPFDAAPNVAPVSWLVARLGRDPTGLISKWLRRSSLVAFTSVF